MPHHHPLYPSHPPILKSVTTYITTLYKSYNDRDAVSCLVLASENSYIYVLDPEAFTILSRVCGVTLGLWPGHFGAPQMKVPSTPVFISTTGLFDVDYCICVACRDATIYTLKRLVLNPHPLNFPSPSSHLPLTLPSPSPHPPSLTFLCPSPSPHPPLTFPYPLLTFPSPSSSSPHPLSLSSSPSLLPKTLFPYRGDSHPQYRISLSSQPCGLLSIDKTIVTGAMDNTLSCFLPKVPYNCGHTHCNNPHPLWLVIFRESGCGQSPCQTASCVWKY